jgi:hypothetical protein
MLRKPKNVRKGEVAVTVVKRWNPCNPGRFNFRTDLTTINIIGIPFPIPQAIEYSSTLHDVRGSSDAFTRYPRFPPKFGTCSSPLPSSAHQC